MARTAAAPKVSGRRASAQVRAGATASGGVRTRGMTGHENDPPFASALRTSYAHYERASQGEARVGDGIPHSPSGEFVPIPDLFPNHSKKTPGINPGSFRCERATGIEPAYRAWEASALPLSYARMAPEGTGLKYAIARMDSRYARSPVDRNWLSTGDPVDCSSMKPTTDLATRGHSWTLISCDIRRWR